MNSFQGPDPLDPLARKTMTQDVQQPLPLPLLSPSRKMKMASIADHVDELEFGPVQITRWHEIFITVVGSSTDGEEEEPTGAPATSTLQQDHGTQRDHTQRGPVQSGARTAAKQYARTTSAHGFLPRTGNTCRVSYRDPRMSNRSWLRGESLL